MAKLIIVSLAAWSIGIVVYLVISAAPLRVDALAGLAVYGAMFAAIPALFVFWLVPVFAVLRRRQAAFSAFVLLAVGSCVGVGVLANSVPSTASGPLSGEAMRFYLMYGVIGLVLGTGYMWARPPVGG